MQKKYLNGLCYLLAGLVLLVSCQESHYTIDDFARVDKIDTHVHIHTKNTAFADQAEADHFRLLNVSVDVKDYPSIAEQEHFALSQIKSNPETVNYLTAFTLKDWDSTFWADETIRQLKASFEHGALGIKVWKNIGMEFRDASGKLIMIDDPKFDPVIQYVIDQDKTVMGHLGEPKNCWLPLDQMTVNNDREYFKAHPEYHMYLHPDMPSYEDQVAARDRFLERHPDMRFVGAHLGSLEWDVDELAKRLDKFPNMAVDVAARVPHLQYQTQQNRDKVRNFFIKYQDRLIYGSDSEISDASDPDKAKASLHDRWLADWKYFVTAEELSADEVNGTFLGLYLPKEVVDKLYRLNAIRWFKMPE